MEQQHGDRVGEPMLLALLVDVTEAVQRRLDGFENGREEGVLAVEDARHVAAERLHQRDHDRAINDDLCPADECHGARLFQNRSGRSRA